MGRKVKTTILYEGEELDVHVSEKCPYGHNEGIDIIAVFEQRSVMPIVPCKVWEVCMCLGCGKAYVYYYERVESDTELTAF